MRSSLWLFVCILYLQLPANSFGKAQAEKRVTLSGTFTLHSIFREIEKQTGKRVYYTNAIINDEEKVAISFKSVGLNDALKQILQNRNLEWSIDGKNISIRQVPKNGGLAPSTFFDSTLSITAKIINENGEPVSGATVLIKGASKGTTSSLDGSFKLNNIKPNSVIIISNVGFVTKEVILRGGSSTSVIQLEKFVGTLDETQIIAYGETSKRINPGNVTTIKADEIARQPVNNPLLALQARVPGLIITPTTGLAGGAVNIQLRGNNSLNFVSSPLIIVDGLPTVNNIAGLGHMNLLTLSSLGFINPNDIETISVLKDADATSIYGSRGSNGVILITTKKGKKGAAKFNINAQTGFANVPRKVKLLHTADYIEMRKEAYANDDRTIALANAPDLLLWDQSRYTDWQEKLIGNTAKYNDVQLSISGGDNNLQYQVGGSYHRETTVFPDDKSDQKVNVHFSVNSTSQNQKVQTAFNVSYLVDRNNLPGVDLTNDALRLAPNAPEIFNSDGTLNWARLPSGTESWKNPYSELYRPYYGRVNNLLGGGSFMYKIMPSLSFKTQVGYNYLIGKSSRLVPLASLPFGTGLRTNSSFNETEVQNVSIEPQFEFKNKLGPGSISVLVGTSFQSTKTSNQLTTAFGFTDDAFLQNLSAAESYSLFNESRQYKYAAVFGRLTYNIYNKYIINITGRRDGSSRFGPGRQFGNFGSIGAAWLFSEENFLKSSLNFLSSGKLRVSYGTSGNDGVDDYAYLERYEIINFVDPYQDGKGYRTLGIFNQYYGWESTHKAEIGLEIGFFNDRLLLEVSAYRNRSDNQLLLSPYPSTAGPGSAYINYPGLVQNTGIESAITADIIQTRSFLWSAGLNFTKYDNKLVSFKDFENSFYYYDYEIGKPFFGYARTYKAIGVDRENGLYQFRTKNGDIVADASDPTARDGGKYMRIRTIPLYYGGMSNTLKFKNLTLDVFLQFTKQNGISHLVSYVPSAGTRLNLPEEFLSRWKEKGDETDIQKLTTRLTTDAGRSAQFQLRSDRYYTDASFIRLKNVSLTYSISKRILSKLDIEDLKLYIHGQNLFTWTRYRGLDPETQNIGSIPPLRVITFGVNVTF